MVGKYIYVSNFLVRVFKIFSYFLFIKYIILVYKNTVIIKEYKDYQYFLILNNQNLNLLYLAILKF